MEIIKRLWRGFRRLPTRVQVIVWVVFALFAFIGGVTDSAKDEGDTEAKSTTTFIHSDDADDGQGASESTEKESNETTTSETKTSVESTSTTGIELVSDDGSGRDEILERFVELVNEEIQFFEEDDISFSEASAAADQGDYSLLELIDTKALLRGITGYRRYGSSVYVETEIHPDGGGWTGDNREIAQWVCGVVSAGGYELRDEITYIEIEDKFGGRLARCRSFGH